MITFDNTSPDVQMLVNYADEVFTTKTTEPEQLRTKTLHTYRYPFYLLNFKEYGWAEEACVGYFYLAERVVPRNAFDGLWALSDNLFARWALIYRNMETSYTSVHLLSGRRSSEYKHSAIADPKSPNSSGRTFQYKEKWRPTFQITPRITAAFLLTMILIGATVVRALYVCTTGIKLGYSFSAKLLFRTPNLDGFNSYQNHLMEGLQDAANSIPGLALATLFPERALMMIADKVEKGTADHFFAKFEDLNGRRGVYFID
ncbi:hypothetical protein COB11_05735 [Candidatus Aerophobetes bacterium]|uniref:Uncharacterized protein n=1 Tax=Aerophobetes bacterium TaxID=2030807 RepID=A0A2A4YEE8_UNCAE|nr:MAG: hypothetical protein COB11_05735 [Candidatus Aerophobetes bacterium]